MPWLKDLYHRAASPPHFYRLAGTLTPWLAWPAALLIAGGLFAGLVLAPADYQQGDGFRIIYVHVPSAWLSMFGYTFMAVSAGIGLIWRIKLAHAVALAAAPVGAWFTFLALFTGSLWGIPMWGTWWVWDARLTSELILLFLYLGYMAMARAFEDPDKGERAAALLAVVGIVNVPIIHFSVKWWNTLHQGPTVTKIGAPSITLDMLLPLLATALGFMCFFGAVVLVRVRTGLIRREWRARWVRRELTGEGQA